jgi:hypothetical protein
VPLNVQDDFYSAAIPEPATVMGLRLKPFSLGHVILLGRVRSSFVTEGEQTSLHDLALSVLICALEFKEGLEIFNNKELPKFFVKWHNKLAGISFLTQAKLRKPKPIDYASHAKAFGEYVQRGSRVPQYSYNPTDFKQMECPSVQIVKTTLMRDMHFREAELMDRPWGLCLWDFVTLRALAGQVAMVDGDAIKQAQEVADAMAKRMKEVHNGT